jgi:hypothetical protein
MDVVGSWKLSGFRKSAKTKPRGWYLKRKNYKYVLSTNNSEEVLLIGR